MNSKINKTFQRLINGDARDLSHLDDESIHLVVTSPPYWNLKRYNENPDQLGHINDYESFLGELEKVWQEVFRVLVPGGRLVCVVGDVCVSRRRFGRHLVFPLHADISVLCRKIGFDNLNPIIWYKIANASFEVENGSKFLGKPYEPNAIIKNDMEFILMQRKPGGYRKPTEAQRKLSKIDKKDFDNWFLGLEALSDEDRRVVRRARRLQRYLTQPFHVVAQHTGIDGISVPLERTLADCEAFIRGEYDDVPEEHCYMRGTMQADKP